MPHLEAIGSKTDLFRHYEAFLTNRLIGSALAPNFNLMASLLSNSKLCAPFKPLVVKQIPFFTAQRKC